MIRYRYLTQINPAAPFVNLVLRNPVTGAELRDVPAQIDTAADRTVIPQSLVKSLSLPQIGSILLGGLGGVSFSLTTHAVQIGLHDLPLQMHKVAAHADESWVLLGRDLLNSLRVLLDGPQLVLEVG